MPERVKTSFIPKQSLKVERTESVRKTTFGVVNVLASVILIAAIIAAVAMFGFESYVRSSITSKRASLDRARAAFQPETIKELARLDTRLSVGMTLLSSHVAPSTLFSYIEDETLSSVRFKDFAYSEVGPGRTMLTMSGEARSFNAVALQSDAFGRGGMFSEVIFSNLNIDSNGNVVFGFSGIVNTEKLLYQPGVASEAQTEVNQVEPVATTSVEVVPSNGIDTNNPDL